MKRQAGINLFGAIVIVVLCWAVFGRSCCGKSAPIVNQPTQTIKEQEKAVGNIEQERKRLADSFYIVLKAKDDLANYNYNKWQQTDVKLTMAERAVDGLLNDTQNTPDTCKPIIAQIQLGFNEVKRTYAQRDAQALNTIHSLQSLTATQKQFLSNKDSMYAKIKNSFDTCIASAKYYKQQADNNKPRNKLAIGPEVNFYPVFGYGLEVDFIHKKGIIVSASGMTMNNQLYGKAGIKKVISFKK